MARKSVDRGFAINLKENRLSLLVCLFIHSYFKDEQGLDVSLSFAGHCCLVTVKALKKEREML